MSDAVGEETMWSHGHLEIPVPDAGRTGNAGDSLEAGIPVRSKYSAERHLPPFQHLRLALSQNLSRLILSDSGMVAFRPEPPCKPNRPQSAESLRVSGPKPGSRGQPMRPRALFAKWRAQW